MAACRTVQYSDIDRDATMTCAYSVNDPRLDGAERLTFSNDSWGGGSLAVQWGHGRIETPGGTWEGDWRGVVFPGTRDEITLWYDGADGYEGLTLYLSIRGRLGRYEVEGIIFPGEAPPR